MQDTNKLINNLSDKEKFDQVTRLGELKDKVYNSFTELFNFYDSRDIENIQIQDNYGIVNLKTGSSWTCKLHTFGVKKNSWRKE